MNKVNNYPIRSAYVLGSSSQIAKKICIELAKRGCVKFHLLTRNLDNNKELINHLKKKYSVEVNEECFDILSEQNTKKDVKDFDLYLITVGALGDEKLASCDFNEARKITDSNYTGLLYWINAITTPKRLNTEGRLWIFSSVAGDIGRPSNYHYGAAKAALTIFSQGLYLKCENKPFAVRIFKAGFIDTRMTLGKAPKYLCMSTDDLAKKILKDPNRRGIEYLPWWWSFIMKILSISPSFIKSKL